MVNFVQNLVNALQYGSFYALIALGYSMVYGVLMLFNFAHGDIFMVGAYIGFGVATGLLAISGHMGGWLPGPVILVLTILCSMVLTAVVGIIVERVGYRPLREAPRASAAITGLMIGIILETGNLAIFGAQRLRFPSLIESATYDVGGVFITNKKIMIVIVSIALMYALHVFIQRTKWGMAMRAMAYDYVVVPLMGVPLNKIAAMTFALGSGLPPRRASSTARPIHPGPVHGHHLRLESVRGRDSGGRGSVLGATLAGFLLGFIEIFVAAYLPSTFRDLIAYSIILMILVYRPHGFFGEPHSAQLRL